jgi:hypothetical protein
MTLDYVDAERAVSEWRSAGWAITELFRLLAKKSVPEIYTETVRLRSEFNRQTERWMSKGILGAERYTTNPGGAWRDFAESRDTAKALAAKWQEVTKEKQALPQALKESRDPPNDLDPKLKFAWPDFLPSKFTTVFVLLVAGVAYLFYTGRIKLGK